MPSVDHIKSVQSIVCNGVGCALEKTKEPTKDEPQSSSKKVYKMLPRETITCANDAASEVINELSSLSLNGIDYLKDAKPVAPLHSNKLRTEAGQNKTITDVTTVSETQSYSSRPVISNEDALVQESSNKCTSKEEDFENVSTSTEETKCATLTKDQLVMCCDSSNQLSTDISKAKWPLDDNIENPSSIDHAQISQKEMGNEIVQGRRKSNNILETPAKEDAYIANSPIQGESNKSETKGNLSNLLDNTESAGAGKSDVTYVVYESELNMPDIIRLIQKDLSEPYSIYTYRYFIHNWPHLCFMVSVVLNAVISITRQCVNTFRNMGFAHYLCKQTDIISSPILKLFLGQSGRGMCRSDCMQIRLPQKGGETGIYSNVGSGFKVQET